MKTNIFALLLVVLLVSCNNTSVVDTNTLTVIDFEPQNDNSMSLSEISSSVKVVPLETSDDCLLGETARIKINGTTIYILSQNSIMMFDMNGKYLSKIDKKGIGPDEYTSITDFDVKNNGNVLIYSRAQKSLFEFDYSSALISKKELDFYASNIKLIDDTFIVFLLGNEISGIYDHKYILMNLSDNSFSQFIPIDKHKAEYLNIIPNIYSSSFNNKTYLFECSNDFVYYFDSDKIYELYQINLGGKNIPSGFYEQDFSDVMDYAMTLMQHGGYAEGILAFFETNNNYYVEYNYQRKCHFAVHNKNNNKLDDFTTIIVDSMFNYPIPLNEIEPSAFADKFIIMIQSSSFIKYVEENCDSEALLTAKKLVNYSGIEQNPILLIISFK